MLIRDSTYSNFYQPSQVITKICLNSYYIWNITKEKLCNENYLIEFITDLQFFFFFLDSGPTYVKVEP